MKHCIGEGRRYLSSAMTPNLALWIFIAFLLAGGLMGFLKAGSKASLIASSIFALPLVLAALGWLPAWVADAVLGLLLVYMGMKFARTRKLMPSGLMAILSAATLIARFVLK